MATPVADFTVSEIVAVIGVTNVGFNDTSTNEPDEWAWTFGDGGTSTLQNPSHIYTTLGAQTVTLTATNVDGSDDETKIGVITIYEQVGTALTTDKQTSTTNIAIDFTANPSGSPTSYQWEFGDGGSSFDENISHTYATSGIYTVTLTTGNEASSNIETKTEYITINDAVVANFNVDNSTPIVDDEVQFTDTSAGVVTSWEWNFGDGSPVSNLQNPTHTYTVKGSYTVTLTVTDAFETSVETKTDFMTVQARTPVADFSADVLTVLQGVTEVQFTDLSTNLPESWFWYFEPGSDSTLQNPTHIFTSIGLRTIELTATNTGGSDGEQKIDYINVLSQVTSDFEAYNPITSNTSGTPSTAFLFNPITTVTPTGYLWNFGDGTTSEETSPTHQYATSGIYTISLTVTNEVSTATETKTDYLTVNPVVVGDFTASPLSGVANVDEIQFTDTSIGVPITWDWNFGDSQGTSTEQNPTYTYNIAGTYTVTLTVSDVHDNSTVTKENLITIYEQMVSDFEATPVSGYPNTEVTFNPILPGITPTGYLWDFGDGETSIESAPLHTYTSVGNYTVSLTVSNELSTDTETKTDFITIVETPPPVADFTVDNATPTVDDQIQFTDTSTSTVPIVLWNWNFGDGESSSDQNPTHTYTLKGLKTVSLNVTDERSHSHEVIKEEFINVIPRTPEADFQSDVQIALKDVTEVQFTDLSTNLPEEWYWDFGDGNSNLQNVGHIFTTPGLHTITLTASNAGGSSYAEKIDYINIVEQVESDFEAVITTSGTPSTTFLFNPITAVTPTGYLWDFGDGVTSEEMQPTHQYAAIGLYTVSLTMTNELTTDTETKVDYITVNPVVSGDFTASNTNPLIGEEIQFTDTSIGIPITWEWDFGDGSSVSTEQNPTHTYALEGAYTVTLNVTDVHDLSTEVKIDYINVTIQAPEADFSADVVSGIANATTINFTDSSTNFPTSWAWNFGDEGTSTDQNPTYLYTTSGVYTVSLIATNSAGSHEKIRVDYITIRNAMEPPVAEFSGVPTSGVVGTVVVFSDSSSEAMSWAWAFGDGNTSTNQNPSNTYSASGVYTVTLTVTNESGSDEEVKVGYITITEATPPAPPAPPTPKPTTKFEKHQLNSFKGKVVSQKNDRKILSKLPIKIEEQFRKHADEINRRNKELLGL